MKIIPSDLLEHYRQGTTTLAYFIRIERMDGQVFRFNSSDMPAQAEVGFEAVAVYGPGFDVSAIASSSTLAVSNLEITVFPDPDNFTRESMLSGLWDNARFLIFEANRMDPSMGINAIKRGRFGEFGVDRGKFTVELRGLSQALRQTPSKVTAKTCSYQLGDARCAVDLAPFQHAGTVTATGGRRLFVDSANPNNGDAGWYQDGEVIFTSGENSGFKQKVKRYSSSEIELALPMPYPIVVGDAYLATAGCPKTREACRDKFSNVVRFGGEPDLPGQDAISRPPITSV